LRAGGGLLGHSNLLIGEAASMGPRRRAGITAEGMQGIAGKTTAAPKALPGSRPPLREQPVALLVDELPALGDGAGCRFVAARQPVGPHETIGLELGPDLLLDGSGQLMLPAYRHRRRLDQIALVLLLGRSLGRSSIRATATTTEQFAEEGHRVLLFCGGGSIDERTGLAHLDVQIGGVHVEMIWPDRHAHFNEYTLEVGLVAKRRDCGATAVDVTGK